MSVQDAAKLAGVSVAAVYKACREGRLAYKTILGRKAILPADLQSCQWGTYTLPVSGEKRIRQRISRTKKPET